MFILIKNITETQNTSEWFKWIRSSKKHHKNPKKNVCTNTTDIYVKMKKKGYTIHKTWTIFEIFYNLCSLFSLAGTEQGWE